MESDSDDAGPAKTHAPSTQRGGKVRVEREPAEDWPQLVRRCNELNVGARELGLDQSLDEELSVIAASKQHSRYKQKRRKKLRQQVLRAIAAAEVVGLPPLMPHAAASSMPLQPRPVSAVGEAASAMHEAATCGDEPVALRALFVMLTRMRSPTTSMTQRPLGFPSPWQDPVDSVAGRAMRRFDSAPRRHGSTAAWGTPRSRSAKHVYDRDHSATTPLACLFGFCNM